MKNDEIIGKIKDYLKDNLQIILITVVVALAAYGFELFNLNLTIDEELASMLSSAPIERLEKGRWGMYFLNQFMFPFTVIPFVPLFVALIFHIGAILLIIESLEVKGIFERTVICAIGISWPGMVYIYSFSNVNYGVGIGLFCIALSLFIFVKNVDNGKLWAVIPAVFAISIYQPFIPALIAVYLLYIICSWDKTDFERLKILTNISIVILLAGILYYLIQKLLLVLYKASSSSYVSNYFDIKYLHENWNWVLTKLVHFIFYVYSGDETIYGIKIRAIGVILIVLGLGVIFNVLRSRLNYLNKILLFFLLICLTLVPFIGGLFTKGYIPARSLVGMPIVLIGWIIYGLNYRSSIYKSFIALLTIICVFQFISSTNHLFASSHFALEEDRLLGLRLITRIEDAQAEFNSEIKYMEIIGYLNRPSTELIPKIDIIGASFFEWGNGDVVRVLSFLKTIGYDDLQALPLEQRGQMVKTANSMPNWPNIGSVKIVDDVILIKFGPYSDDQKAIICQSAVNRAQIQEQKFCP